MSDDFSALKNKLYSGRGITIGRTPKHGNLFVGYTLTGRSPPSQARELVYDQKSGVVRTEVTDPKQLEEGSPALLIYPALAFIPKRKTIVASNGAQTRLLFSSAYNDFGRAPEVIFEDAFRVPVWEYDKKNKEWIDITSFEPDFPNNTPRINAVLDHFSAFPKAGFNIIKQGMIGKASEFHQYDELQHGKGKTITTYLGGNEKPLLSFTGQPLDVSIESENAADIAEGLYDAIGPNSLGNQRVSVAVMLMGTLGGLEVSILNRSQKGS